MNKLKKGEARARAGSNASKQKEPGGYFLLENLVQVLSFAKDRKRAGAAKTVFSGS